MLKERNKMSEYSQQEQTEIIRDIMSLTTTILIEEKELSKQRNAKYRTLPPAPTRKILEVPNVEPQIPPVPQSTYTFSEHMRTSFNKVLYLTILCWPILVYLLVKEYKNYNNTLENYNKQLANSPEYLKKVEEAKKIAAEKQEQLRDQVAKQQAELDAKYKSDLEHYNTVTIPEYNKAYQQWKTIQSKKIAALEEDMDFNKDTLEQLYNSTKLVSITYRELWILRWLYDDMNSSDHDIRYATELLDRDRQRFATEQSGRLVQEAINNMNSSMMNGFQAIYEAVENGNDEMAKMRCEQNRANTIAIIQRHNLNKMVKEQNKMFDKHFNRK